MRILTSFKTLTHQSTHFHAHTGGPTYNHVNVNPCHPLDTFALLRIRFHFAFVALVALFFGCLVCFVYFLLFWNRCQLAALVISAVCFIFFAIAVCRTHSRRCAHVFNPFLLSLLFYTERNLLADIKSFECVDPCFSCCLLNCKMSHNYRISPAGFLGGFSGLPYGCLSLCRIVCSSFLAKSSLSISNIFSRGPDPLYVFWKHIWPLKSNGFLLISWTEMRLFICWKWVLWS